MDMIVPQSAVVYVQGLQVNDLRALALHLKITGIPEDYFTCGSDDGAHRLVCTATAVVIVA